jgi:hypothetical protein
MNAKSIKSIKPAAAKINEAATAVAIRGLQGMQAADGAATDALLTVFRACAAGAVVTAAMLGEYWPASNEASRGVYVSEFGTAGKVAAIIGEPATLRLIDDAAKLSGRARVNVMAALRGVRTIAKEAGATVATKAQANKFAQQAVKVAKANGAAVKVKAKAADARKPRQTENATASLKGSQAVMGPKSLCASLQVLIGNAREIAKTVDPAHRAVWDAAVKGLSTSFEGFAMCAK